MYTSSFNFDYPNNILNKLFTMEELNRFKESKDFEDYKNLLVMKDKLNYKQSKKSEHPINHVVYMICMLIFILSLGSITGHTSFFLILSVCSLPIYPLIVGLFKIITVKNIVYTEQSVNSLINDLKTKNKVVEYIDDYLIAGNSKSSRSHTLMGYMKFFSQLSNFDNVNIYYSAVNLTFKEHAYDVMYKNILFEELKTGTYFTIAYNLSDSVTNALITKLSVFEINKETLELEQKV